MKNFSEFFELDQMSMLDEMYSERMKQIMSQDELKELGRVLQKMHISAQNAYFTVHRAKEFDQKKLKSGLVVIFYKSGGFSLIENVWGKSAPSSTFRILYNSIGSYTKGLKWSNDELVKAASLKQSASYFIEIGTEMADVSALQTLRNAAKRLSTPKEIEQAFKRKYNKLKDIARSSRANVLENLKSKLKPLGYEINQISITKTGFKDECYINTDISQNKMSSDNDGVNVMITGNQMSGTFSINKLEKMTSADILNDCLSYKLRSEVKSVSNVSSGSLAKSTKKLVDSYLNDISKIEKVIDILKTIKPQDLPVIEY